MKKLISVILVLFTVVLAFSGCWEKRSEDIPRLSVSCGDSSIEADVNNSTFGDEDSHVAKDHPALRNSELPVLKILVPYGASEKDFQAQLFFNVDPDSVSVECWKSDDWYSPSNTKSEVTVNNNEIILRPYVAVYCVNAKWEGKGEISYAFVTEIFKEAEEYPLYADFSTYLDAMNYFPTSDESLMKEMKKYRYNGIKITEIESVTCGCGSISSGCGVNYRGLFAFGNSGSLRENGIHRSKDYFYTSVPLEGLYMPYQINFQDSVQQTLYKSKISSSSVQAFLDSAENNNLTLWESDDSSVILSKIYGSSKKPNEATSIKLEYSERYQRVNPENGRDEMVTRYVNWKFDVDGKTMKEFGYGIWIDTLRPNYGIPGMYVFESESIGEFMDAVIGACQWSYVDIDGELKHFDRETADMALLEEKCPRIEVDSNASGKAVEFAIYDTPDRLEVRRYMSMSLDGEYSVIEPVCTAYGTYGIVLEESFSLVEVVAEWDENEYGIGGTVYYYFAVT